MRKSKKYKAPVRPVIALRVNFDVYEALVRAAKLRRSSISAEANRRLAESLMPARVGLIHGGNHEAAA